MNSRWEFGLVRLCRFRRDRILARVVAYGGWGVVCRPVEIYCNAIAADACLISANECATGRDLLEGLVVSWGRVFGTGTVLRLRPPRIYLKVAKMNRVSADKVSRVRWWLLGAVTVMVSRQALVSGHIHIHADGILFLSYSSARPPSGIIFPF